MAMTRQRAPVGRATQARGRRRAGRGRSDFARDRARVLHSYAFRRLADKTQVVVPGEDDFPRTRLTHSLEVAQIAPRDRGRPGLRSRRRRRGRAGARHRPPAVRAQRRGGAGRRRRSVRRVRGQRADPAHPDPARGEGYRATGEPGRAEPDARSPRRDVQVPVGARREDTGKFGVYAADRDAFAWTAQGAPDGQRCLEAQVMDWADDVAYSVHDVEDGVHAGLDPAVGRRRRGAGGPVSIAAAELYSAQHGRRAGAGARRAARPADAARPGRIRRLLPRPGRRQARHQRADRPLRRRGRPGHPGRARGRRARRATPRTWSSRPRSPPSVPCSRRSPRTTSCSGPARSNGMRRQRRILTELVEALLAGAPASLDRACGRAWRDRRQRRRAAAGGDRPGRAADRLVSPAVAGPARPSRLIAARGGTSSSSPSPSP